MNDFDDITSRLRKLGAEPVDPEVAARHLRACNEVEAVVPPARFRFRPAVAGGILAGALLGGTGLAGATGNLGPLQDEFHSVSAAVGLRVPEGSARPGPGEVKDYAAEAEQKAAEAQRKAQEATEAALRAGETAREAQQEANRVDAPSSPPTTTVVRFYGTPDAPCTIPVVAGEGTKEKDGDGARESPTSPNTDEAKNAPRVPFIVGTHDDYVRAHPPALREEAAKSDCGKPVKEVKPPGVVAPPTPPAPAKPQGANPVGSPSGPPAEADGAAAGKPAEKPVGQPPGRR